MMEGVDAQQVATGLVGLGGFLAAVWAGVHQGLKKAKANEADPSMRIAAGVIMDNTSMLMLSESNRSLCEATYRLRDDVRELSHQVERLRDKMDD